MGLSISQIRLLALTARKADCEYDMSVNNLNKMALTREMTNLTAEYNRKLSAKNITYYANSQYNQVTYAYLMGYGANTAAITENTLPFKPNNNMILSDFNGRVVLSDTYANAIKSVLGSDITNGSGVGSTFSQTRIAEIIAYLTPSFTADDIRDGVDDMGYTTHNENTINRNSTGTGTGDSANFTNSQLAKIIDFYFPIFQAAAANGWTTEYNVQMADNDSYVSDAIVSGTFQLQDVNDFGQYDEEATLQYFITAGFVEQRGDSENRALVQAWYDEEKSIIQEKEDFIDLDLADLSTELEAIKTEMEAVKSYIDDAMQSVFNWGT